MAEASELVARMMKIMTSGAAPRVADDRQDGRVPRSAARVSAGLRLAALLLALGASGCHNGPLPFLSAGRLSGESAPAPADWSFAGASGTAQIETRPEAPYSVNLVYTVVDGGMYVNAGGTETRWVKNIEANPAVRLRIDGKLYDLRAERVIDRAEIETFAKAWTSQSWLRRDPAKLDPVWIFRLVPG